MYKLSIVTAHSETDICVKPGGNTAIKFEWKKNLWDYILYAP
jgi:hypothetical protein